MEGIKIFTARQAKAITIEANKDIINQTIDKIEAAAIQGLSKLTLRNTPEIVIRYLESQGFAKTRSMEITQDSGSFLYSTCEICWEYS